MTDENTVWFTQGTVFKLVCSQGILTLKLRHLQKKKTQLPAAFQEALSLFLSQCCSHCCYFHSNAL